MKQSEIYEAVFGEKYVAEKYKMVPHSFSSGKRVTGKPYCAKCGLVALNNEFTQWSIKHGCMSELHPGYAAARTKANPFARVD